MKLIDMKLPKKTESELKDCCAPCSSGQQDRWPYGLQLRFETEQVEKMPSLKDYKVGDKIIVSAEATVTEVRMSETQSKDKDKQTRYTVELQIQQIGCEPKSKKPVKEMSSEEYRKARERGEL